MEHTFIENRQGLAVPCKAFLAGALALSTVSLLPSFGSPHASGGRKVNSTANPNIMSVAIQNG